MRQTVKRDIEVKYQRLTRFAKKCANKYQHVEIIAFKYVRAKFPSGEGICDVVLSGHTSRYSPPNAEKIAESLESRGIENAEYFTFEIIRHRRGGQFALNSNKKFDARGREIM